TETSQGLLAGQALRACAGFNRCHLIGSVVPADYPALTGHVTPLLLACPQPALTARSAATGRRGPPPTRETMAIDLSSARIAPDVTPRTVVSVSSSAAI